MPLKGFVCYQEHANSISLLFLYGFGLMRHQQLSLYLNVNVILGCPNLFVVMAMWKSHLFRT